jgi:hypothetical protein
MAKLTPAQAARYARAPRGWTASGTAPGWSSDRATAWPLPGQDPISDLVPRRSRHGVLHFRAESMLGPPDQIADRGPSRSGYRHDASLDGQCHRLPRCAPRAADAEADHHYVGRAGRGRRQRHLSGRGRDSFGKPGHKSAPSPTATAVTRSRETPRGRLPPDCGYTAADGIALLSLPLLLRLLRSHLRSAVTFLRPASLGPPPPPRRTPYATPFTSHDPPTSRPIQPSRSCNHSGRRASLLSERLTSWLTA